MKIELSKALRAGYDYFYCQSYEIDRTVENIKFEINQIDKAEWKMILWDFNSSGGDPDEVMNVLNKVPSYTAIVAKNLHWFLQDSGPNGKLNYSLVQYLQDNASTFSTKSARKALIIVGEKKFDQAIPDCLKKLFLSISFPLPDANEIENIMEMIIDFVNQSPNIKEEFKPTSEQRKEIIRSALGLTKQGASNAMAYSVIQTSGKIDPKIVADIRCAEVNETSGLRVGTYADAIEPLGYDRAKRIIRKGINNPKSRGVLIVGPAGTGKTTLAKWASTVASKILIEFEMAKVQGSGLYGQAEEEMGTAIEVIKAVGESVLFVDELEKAIPWKEARGDTTGTRSFGQFLKFLSDDRPSGCYVIATSNDITKLPPEWVRSGRFDIIFYVGLPNTKAKTAIYEFYLNKYMVETGGFVVSDMPDWTGGEIETACRLADVLEVPVKEAAENVCPISATMAEDIEALERWAKGRTVPAEDPEDKSKLSRVRALD